MTHSFHKFTSFNSFKFSSPYFRLTQTFFYLFVFTKNCFHCKYRSWLFSVNLVFNSCTWNRIKLFFHCRKISFCWIIGSILGVKMRIWRLWGTDQFKRIIVKILRLWIYRNVVFILSIKCRKIEFYGLCVVYLFSQVRSVAKER